MARQRWRALFTALTIAFATFPFFPKPVQADCDTRPTAKEEQAFYQRFNAVAGKALGTPEGWQSNNGGELYVPKSVCTGSENEPARAQHSVSLERVEGSEARAAKVDEAMNKGMAKLATVKDQVAKLQEELNQISAEMEKAAQKNDYARIEKLGQQAQAKTEQIIALQSPIADEANAEAVQIGRDTKIWTELSVNETMFDLEGFEKIPAPRPGMTAYQKPVHGSETGEIVTILLWGKWKERAAHPSGRTLQPVFDPKMRHEAIQNATLQIQSDPERVGSYLKAIDLEAIGSLLGK